MEKNTSSKPFFKRKGIRITYFVFLHAFAIAGAAIIGAWAIYKLGLTNNRGAIDQNNRYLAEVATIEIPTDSVSISAADANRMIKMAALNKVFPFNGQIIWKATRYCENPQMIDQMIAAAEVYIKDNEEYNNLKSELETILGKNTNTINHHVVPWMNTQEWEALKVAILKDKKLIDSAAYLTGVEPRLIVGCLVGEQIRLFNSKRETYKKYLGPVKVLSVQSQFSLGVNGIKEFTARQVENNLKNDTSIFYMGKEYEHLLDFKTNEPDTERVARLVDYRNHLFSYIYTGCILHQTMLQWKRSGFDISDRPDLLFTLFNVGFPQSKPKADPKCGGSHITVADKIYTFGAIGFDFYYSGELAEEFPLHIQKFRDNNNQTSDSSEENTDSHLSLIF
ncbi:MAG: hypothetical protein IKY22_10680 [Bacteroidales bacterium]|nr:hypothetical protein [Bacteroidales bacterium]